MEFPHLQELYTKLKDQGFGLVCVNYGDSATVVQEFVHEKDWSFPIVLGGNKDDYYRDRIQGSGVSFKLLVGPQWEDHLAQ